MTSNLEQLKKDGMGELVRDFTAMGFMAKSEATKRFEELIDKAYALGTLNGLDKAIELLPEEIPYEKGSEFIGECDYTKCDVNDSFNACRSQILSKIKEEKDKLWN